jgi:hypothetical protein
MIIKKNGFRNFSFGDIIILEGKKYRFIELDGEDYILKGMNGVEDTYTRAYYWNKHTKVKEEMKKVTTYEFGYDKEKDS